MLSIVYRKTKRMANTTTQNNRTNGNKYMEITIIIGAQDSTLAERGYT